MNNTVKKIVVSVTVLTCAAWMGSGVAQAITAEQLSECIIETESYEDLKTCLAGLIEEEEEEVVTIEGIPADFTFETNLKQTDTGDDVKYLQIVLNSDSETQLAESGVGSPGNETSYFGPLTKAAVIKFQEKYADDVLASWGLTEGTGFVGSTTRAKLNSLLAAAEEEEEEEEEELGPGLTVALAADTPAAAIVPDDSMAVFTKFSFANGEEEDVTIESLKLKRFGVGSSSDFDGVYLYDGDTRLTSGRTVSSTTNYVEFNNVDIVVEAGTTKVISVKIDGADSQTGTSGFSIEAAEDVGTSASVSGDFPLRGNQMTYSDVDLGLLTIASDGTVANPTIGASGATVEKFSLNATNENIDVYSVAFEQTGTADLPYLENWELYQAGNQVGTGSVLGDIVTLVLDEPFTVEDGLTKVFEVRVDIGAGVDPSDDIDLELEESIDLYGVGATFGYGVAVLDSHSGDDVACQGGTVTFGDQGPNAGDVKIGGNDVVFLKFYLAAATDIVVKDLDVVIHDISGTEIEYLQDIRLRNADTGVTLMGPKDHTQTDGEAKIDFTQDFDVAAGETLNLEITADIDIDTTPGEDFQISLVMSTSDLHNVEGNDGVTLAIPVIKDLENNTITDIVPSTHIEGEEMNAVDSYLVVALSSSPTGSINVQNASDLKALGLSLGAGEASDIEVTDITVYFVSETAEPEDIISAVYLKDAAGALIAGPETITAGALKTGNATFDGMSIDVPAGGGTKVIVEVDIATLGAEDAFGADIVATAAGVTTNISAYDEDGSLVTIYDEDGPLTGGDWATDNYLNDVGGGGVCVPVSDQNASDCDVEIELITSGYLVIEEHSPNVDESIIVGGSTDASIGMIDFTAYYEGMYVEKLTFIATEAGDFSGVTIGYPDEDGDPVSQPSDFVEATSSATFSGMTMYVPKDETVTMTIKGNVKSVADPAVTSGDTIDTDLDVSAVAKVVSASGTVDEDIDNTTGLVGAAGSTLGSLVALTNITSTNHEVYATKPTLALNGASPSGTSVQSTTDDVLIFDITADTAKSVKVRKGSQNEADSATNWGGGDDDASTDGTDPTPTADTGNYVETTGSVKTTPTNVADTLTKVYFDAYADNGNAAVDLSGYTGVSFWVRTDDDGTTAGQLTFDMSETDQTLSAVDASDDMPALDGGSVWEFVSLDFGDLASTRNAVKSWGITVSAGLAANKSIWIDDVRFFKEKVTVDFASDGSMITTAGEPIAYLLRGTTYVADGYLWVDTTSAASVTFIPVGSYGTINVGAGDTETFTVLINTTAAVDDEGGDVNDLLTPSITFGTASSVGDFYWYDGYATATWNDSPGLQVTGKTLIY